MTLLVALCCFVFVVFACHRWVLESFNSVTVTVIARNIADSFKKLIYQLIMKQKIIAKRMKSLGSETRLAVFSELMRAGIDGVPVGQVQKKLNVPASTLTHHLHKLIDAGLAHQERKGAVLMCFANFEAMMGTFQFFANNCCADENQTTEKEK